jgi:hypothetical protein
VFTYVCIYIYIHTRYIRRFVSVSFIIVITQFRVIKAIKFRARSINVIYVGHEKASSFFFGVLRLFCEY